MPAHRQQSEGGYAMANTILSPNPANTVNRPLLALRAGSPIVVIWMSAALTLAGDPVELPAGRAQAELEAATKFLRQHKATGGDLQVKSDSVLAKVFPDYAFVVVRYRQFPVARVIPEGFKASNLLAIAKETTVSHLKDIKEQEKFFREHAAAARTANDLTDVLSAWLTLSQEHHQDGFYKFEILTKDFDYNKERTQVRGRAVVMQGGNGELTATLDLEDGKLARVSETAKIRPGPRPICQATRLLDVDPVVRTRFADYGRGGAGISGGTTCEGGPGAAPGHRCDFGSN
jgi:hypothetical protein